MKPVTPSSMTSRTDPRGHAMTGVPQAIASIITSPERLRPVDRKQQGGGVAKEGLLLPVIHLANEPDIVLIEERLDRLVEIAIFPARHLGGNAQWQARAMGHPDRDIRTLLRRDPAQKGQIAFRLLGELEQVRGHAVMNRGQPVEAGKRRALAL